MNPIIDHIQITVKNLEVDEPFYDKLMPILGFDINRKSKGTVKAHEFDVIDEQILLTHHSITLNMGEIITHFSLKI